MGNSTRGILMLSWLERVTRWRQWTGAWIAARPGFNGRSKQARRIKGQQTAYAARSRWTRAPHRRLSFLAVGNRQGKWGVQTEGGWRMRMDG